MQKIKKEIITLADIAKGGKVKLRSISRNSSLRQRFLDLGFVNGSEIEIVRSAPLFDPIHIKIKGYSLAIRRKEAETIEVEFP